MNKDKIENHNEKIDFFNNDNDEEKAFLLWVNWKQFIILPYIGISWEYGFEICFMWAFFCFSISKK